VPGRREQHRPNPDYGYWVGHEDIDPAVGHAALVARDPVGPVMHCPVRRSYRQKWTRAGQYAVADQAAGQGGIAMGADVRYGNGCPIGKRQAQP